MTDSVDDQDLITIIDNAKTIAIVGASNNPVKPSLFVATYFASRGKRIIPINSEKTGQDMGGETTLAGP